ncbi:hypothetical protein SAMN06295998_1381, partial [Primorskyibacter flagellatus]
IQLTAKVAQDATGVTLQLFQGLAHALELARMPVHHAQAEPA